MRFEFTVFTLASQDFTGGWGSCAHRSTPNTGARGGTRVSFFDQGAGGTQLRDYGTVKDVDTPIFFTTKMSFTGEVCVTRFTESTFFYADAGASGEGGLRRAPTPLLAIPIANTRLSIYNLSLIKVVAGSLLKLFPFWFG